MLLLKSKSKHFNQKLNDNGKGNTAALWNTLRQLIPAKTNKSCPLQTGAGEELQNKVNEFNYFLANVGEKTFEKSQHNLPDEGDITQPNADPPNTATCNMFRPHPTDSNTIILILKHLKNTASYNSDGIPLHFLRDSLPVIVTYLTCILNTSIVTGSFHSL